MGHMPVYLFQRYVVCAPPNVVLRTQLGRSEEQQMLFREISHLSSMAPPWLTDGCIRRLKDRLTEPLSHRV